MTTHRPTPPSDPPATDPEILDRLDSLTSAIVAMAKVRGDRLSRAGVCDRMGIHRNTLARYMAEKDFPTPGKDGKWLLSEVLEWETHNHHHG
jgi:predicted DNA-binding transcriptional regulator AlpA